ASRRSSGYNVTMTFPATSRQTRTFDDRADALVHFFLRAGEAPRLLAYDDATGCPLDQALAALEWTAAVGMLSEDDLIHAARLAAGAVQRAARRRALHPAPYRLVRDRRRRGVVPPRSARRALQLPRSRHRYLTGRAIAGSLRDKNKQSLWEPPTARAVPVHADMWINNSTLCGRPWQGATGVGVSVHIGCTRR